MELVAAVGVPVDLWQQGAFVPLEAGFIAATAVRTNELQQISDISELPDYEEYRVVRELQEIGMNSYFAMPLTLGNQRIGVLCREEARRGG